MSVRLMAVGDMFLRTRDGEQNPFAYVEKVFREADIVFGNLEVPLTDANLPSLEQAVLLKSSPESVSFLKEAHFSVVSIAHNHIRDFGDEGALDTIRHLRDAGIQYIGAGGTMSECMKESVIKVNRVTVAFVGFYAFGEGLSSSRFHIAGMDPQLVMHRIAELKDKYDRVVVSFHWGRENVFYPSPEQQAFARYCIDEGASVVIGHHPHYVQGIEEYKGGFIFYSLGNFNFWQFNMPTSYHHRLSCIADIVLEKDKVVYEMIPIMIDDNCCPRPITSPEGRSRFDTHLENISKPLASGVDKWWWFGEIAKPYLLNNGRSFIVRIRRYGIKHLFKMLRWLTSRFVFKCYVGLIRRYLRIGRQYL